MDINDKLFLLDAYALIYRAYYAFIKNPRVNSKGMNTSAILGFVNTLEDVLKKEKPTHIGIAFDPSGPTFRHLAYDQYKAQREETPEAIRESVPIIKEIIKCYHIPILEVNGFEADDVIGTLSLQADKQNIKTWMMTPDKDYGQLVSNNVKMYRPKYGDKDFEVMGIEEVKSKFGIEKPEQIIDLLGLMGDASDNIPGCPGVGEKTAQKLIAEFGSIDNLLEHTDRLKGALKTKIETNREKITFSKFLATIKRDVPIELKMEDLKKEEPDKEGLRKIFEELEFRTLIERVLSEKKVSSYKPVQGDLFASFSEQEERDAEKTSLTTLKDLKIKYKLVDNENEIDKLVQLLSTQKFFVIDTETTSLDTITAKLVGMSFCIRENEAYYVPVPKSESEALKIANKFKDVLEDEKIEKVGLNIKYDMNVLSNYDVEMKGKLSDCMIMHYLLHPELRHNMDYLAEIYLNYQTIHIDELIGKKGKEQKNMRDISPEEAYTYACEDADVTLKLYNKLKAELKESQMSELYDKIEMPLISVLANMERNGVLLDTHALKQSSMQLEKEMTSIEEEIYKMADAQFNISSPKQVGEILFNKLHIVEKPKKTKGGQFVTSEEVLQSLQSHHPIVEKILDYRGLKKLLGTYIDALPKLINPRTGRIHTSYNQAVTTTGRLSSSNPNLQNIPIRDENGKEIRKAFIPDEGCEFFSADYSQIELRVMAHLSQDENMIEAFKQGYDIHAATAAKLYKIDVDKVTSDMRRKAKTANFGIIYGISVFGLAERMNVSRGEAKELIDNYFITYPKVKAYMDESINVAREKGYVETIFHRKRYLPDIHSHNAVVRGYAERNAINSPIQGSAADIMKIAMIRIYERLRHEGLKTKMLLQVHDELNFSVPYDEKEKIEKLVIEEMENAYPMLVPLKADFGWGNNWLEAH